jgi:Ring finger domain
MTFFASRELNNLNSSAVAIITRPPEIIACLKLQLTSRNVFIIFDSRPRPSYPNGAGMIVNTSIEGTASRLTKLLPNVGLPDGLLQWQARLLSVDSGQVTHVFVPRGVETSTPALWQAVLESSVAQLSMQTEISELQSQIESLKNEQQDLGSEIEDGEARVRWQETLNQQQQQQFGSSSNPPAYFDRSSSSDPPPTYYSSSTRRTSRRSRTSPSRVSSTSTLNPFNTSTHNLLNASTLNPFRSFSPSQATLNPFSPDSPSDVISSLDRASSRRSRATRAPTPPSDRDDSISYAIRPQHEFDNEDRALSDPTYATETTTGRAPGRPRRATRAPTPPSDYDDFFWYAMRLQHEIDNEDCALSAERAELATPGRPGHATRAPTPPSDHDDSISYAIRLQHEFDNEDRALSDSTSATESRTGRTPSRPGRATRAPTPPSDRDDSIFYAMRLQREFDNEDRALSAQRAELATASNRDDSILYAMRLQHEFDNEDHALTAQRTELANSAQRLFECGVCLEEMPYDSVASPDPCGHTFCRECLRGYVTARLDERKFPILCPTCTANKGKGKGVDGGTCRRRMVILLTISSHYISLSNLAVHCFKPRTHRQAIQYLD